MPVFEQVEAVAAVTIGTSFTAPLEERKPKTSADLVVYDKGIIFFPTTPHSAFVSASLLALVPEGCSQVQ